MEKEKALALKIRKNSLIKMILGLKATQIIQNFLTKKKKIQNQMTIKEKNLILKKVKKDLKIEADLNHLNSKNITKIEKLGEKAATIRILQIEGDKRSILPEHQYADMYVAGIVDRFLPAPVDAIRRRDIIRVRVIENKPVLKVNTRNDENCGVLSALCPQCGESLFAKSNGDYNVHCPQCDYAGYRVLSNGFGQGYSLGQDQCRGRAFRTEILCKTL